MLRYSQHTSIRSDSVNRKQAEKKSIFFFMTSDGPQGELDLKHQEVYAGEEF